MSPQGRLKGADPPMPVIPENNRPSRLDTNGDDDDTEDREEQGLFELDNDNTNVTIPSTENDLQNTINTQADNANQVDPGPFYVQSSVGDKWELTWPIWHMLPRDERRAIATKHGMKSIGEFEEYMSLTRAVDESEVVVGGQKSGVMSTHSVEVFRDVDEVEDLTSRMEGVSVRESAGVAGAEWHPPFIEDIAEGDDDSSVSSSEDDNKPTANEQPQPEEVDLESHLEHIKLGGLPCGLPDEILHKCFSFLPVDDYSPLALVSPHWSRFTRCESLYKTLCERVYLNQSKRKTLHVSRFGNSYRRMLESRPRIRTGGGLYVLKYQEVRKIQRDMWTEIPVGAILESVYYRYLYFFEDGRVMYALTHATPVEMIPRFSRMLLHGYGSKDKWGVWGRYQIRKDEVRVWVSQEWHDVCFQLRVIPSNKFLHYDNGDRGMFTTIALEKHMSSISGNFDEDESRDLVQYDIPMHCYFRFLRDRRL